MPMLQGLNVHRDLVLIDQCGTGGSNRLTCPPFPTLAHKQALHDSVTSCLAHLHDDLRFYTSAMIADDVSQVLASRRAGPGGRDHFGPGGISDARDGHAAAGRLCARWRGEAVPGDQPGQPLWLAELQAVPVSQRRDASELRRPGGGYVFLARRRSRP